MQCREFCEIADSYLSDELLVETNHRIFRHIENCPDCRAEFAQRRELREKLSNAFKNAEEFKIDPAFAGKLQIKLQEEFLGKNIWQKILSMRILLPVMVGLLLIIAFSFAFISRNTSQSTNDLTAQNTLFKTLFSQISHKAAEDHKECAIDHFKLWQAQSQKETAEKIIYTEKIVKPLEVKSSDKIDFISAHDCSFEGKVFTHIILRKDEHTLSILIDKSGEIPALVENLGDSIMLEKDDNLQIAGFQNNNHAVFVISDLPEAQNLKVARTLSDAWKQTL